MKVSNFPLEMFALASVRFSNVIGGRLGKYSGFVVGFGLGLLSRFLMGSIELGVKLCVIAGISPRHRRY